MTADYQPAIGDLLDDERNQSQFRIVRVTQTGFGWNLDVQIVKSA
jgi:hypothetical protein